MRSRTILALSDTESAEVFHLPSAARRARTAPARCSAVSCCMTATNSWSESPSLPSMSRARNFSQKVDWSTCLPKLKVRTPAHAKHPGWYLEFEFRATCLPNILSILSTSAASIVPLPSEAMIAKASRNTRSSFSLCSCSFRCAVAAVAMAIFFCCDSRPRSDARPFGGSGSPSCRFAF